MEIDVCLIFLIRTVADHPAVKSREDSMISSTRGMTTTTMWYL